MIAKGRCRARIDNRAFGVLTMLPAEKTHDSDSTPLEPPSKSARKRAMHDLQQLGLDLVALDPGRLSTLDLPERLVDAIALARGITKHEGRRRQLQYIGKLMRDVDPAPLRTAFAAWERGPAVDRGRFAAAEQWRDRLLDQADGLTEFVAAHPAADRTVLAALVADARAERDRGSPPHKYRALFRELKRIIDELPGD
jgi:ribosome-associated protein